MTTQGQLIEYTTRGVKLLQDGKPEEALRAFKLAERACDFREEMLSNEIGLIELKRQVIATYVGLATLKAAA